MRHLTRIPLPNIKPLVADRQFPKALHDGAFGAPAREYAAGVSAEGDNVAQDLELREGLVDGDGVALAVAFYRGGKAAEAGADDDDFDSRLLGHVEERVVRAGVGGCFLLGAGLEVKGEQDRRPFCG